MILRLRRTVRFQVKGAVEGMLIWVGTIEKLEGQVEEYKKKTKAEVEEKSGKA